MAEERFRSFEEFWPFYVREHSVKANRRLHFAGTTTAVTLFGVGVLTRKRWLMALAPVVGYGPAWIGHFFVEKNRPATFRYPVWSLLADFKMWSLIVRGEMDAEVERVMSESAEPIPSTEPAHNGGSGRMEISHGNGAAGSETLN